MQAYTAAGCALLLLCVELTRRADAHISVLGLYDSIACWQITIWTMALSATSSIAQILCVVYGDDLGPMVSGVLCTTLWAVVTYVSTYRRQNKLQRLTLGWNVAHIVLNALGPQLPRLFPQSGLAVLQMSNVAVICGFWGACAVVAVCAPHGTVSLHPVDEHMRRCIRCRKPLATRYAEVGREVFQHCFLQASFIVGTQLLAVAAREADVDGALPPRPELWGVWWILFQAGLCWCGVSFVGAAVRRYSGGGGGEGRRSNAGAQWRFPYSADPAVRRQRYNSE